MLAATKQETFSAAGDPCVFFQLATCAVVSKNSHLGFGRKNVSPHQGLVLSNYRAALGDSRNVAVNSWQIPPLPQNIGAPTKPQTPWYNTCGAQAAANFALHGGVDAIGLLPGIGDVSEAAVGALGLTAGYGVALMDAATPGGLTNGGVAMQGAGTALFVADASKTSIAAVTRIAATAKFIPFINKLYAAGSLIYDANRAYQAYQACTQGAQ
jgi:hypothetical protein